MNNTKSRLKILQKIAQATTATSPTAPIATTTAIVGTPPTFTATSFYPSFQTAFQAKNVPTIQKLTDLLNTVMFYLSNGQMSMATLRASNFNLGTSQISSMDLRNIINFSKLVYQQIYTHLGQNYSQPLTPAQIAVKMKILQSSTFFNNLPASGPTGQLAD